MLAEDDNTLSPAQGGFVTSTISYTSLASDPNVGSALEIRLLTGGLETNYDFVRLEATTVPEPSTFALVSVCGLLGGIIAWRKRTK